MRPRIAAEYMESDPRMPGGFATTSLPCSSANFARITWSDNPADCIFRIFFLFSQQVRHGYGSMRQAMFILHPQGHSSFSATRFTAGLSSSSALCAKIGTATSAKARRLFLNRRMFLRHSDHLGSRVREPDFAWDQAHQSSDSQHPKSDPDPGDQRENVCLNDGALVVVRNSREVEIQILVETPADRDFRRRLLAGFVQAPLGFHHAERFPALRRFYY